MKYIVKVNGKAYEVEIERSTAGGYAAPQMAAPAYAAPQMAAPAYAAPTPVHTPAPAASAGAEVRSPLAGNIFNILVNVGDRVAFGQNLIVIEAMKMENEVVSPCEGVIKQILVSKGSVVDADDVLIVIQ